MSAFTVLTLLCITLCFVLSTQEKFIAHIDKEAVQKLRQQAAICEKETGVPAATLKKIIDWPVDNDENTKKFVYCVCFNCGYVDKDGHMDLEKMTTFTVKNGAQENYIDSLKECNEITLQNHLETIFAIGYCAHEKVSFVHDG